MNKLALDIGDQFWLKPGQGIAGQFDTLGDLLSVLLPNVYVIAGLVLLIVLILGGLDFIIAAEKSDTERMALGRKKMITGLIGFLIVFASYWFIQLIEAVTGLEIFGGGGGL